MVIVNTNIQRELDRLKAEYAAGLEEGYDADPNRLPAFWHSKTLMQLTARERGFFVGRELRIEELSMGGDK